ncbi:MAG: hypothetical protein O2856_08710 [Planctomycetota bacterium]|nr:hypothetical protein [Planctomycetota bacterium]
MRNLLNLRNLVASAALMGGILMASSTASAGDYCHAPRYYYKNVTVYESVRKPYDYAVVKYDHCGAPYLVTRTAWKTVQVPVTVRVKVQY